MAVGQNFHQALRSLLANYYSTSAPYSEWFRAGTFGLFKAALHVTLLHVQWTLNTMCWILVPSRKNHQRALDSMQASLEAEAKGKAEALRLKKKLEADINELEIALDHANKVRTSILWNIVGPWPFKTWSSSHKPRHFNGHRHYEDKNMWCIFHSE